MSSSNSSTDASGRRRPILIISTGNTFDAIRDEHGDFDDWIAAGLGHSMPVERLDARAGNCLPDPGRFAGAVITGSHAMVTDGAAWSERLAQWLRCCVDRQLPVLGICYGHQLLAHAMGGTVGFHPQGMEIGTHTISLAPEARNDALFNALPAAFPAHLVHAQSVLALPPGARLLASSVHEPHQAFRIGQNAWGVQFHPEFDEAAMRGYRDAMAPALAAANPGTDATINILPDTRHAALLLARFADLVDAVSEGVE